MAENVEFEEIQNPHNEQQNEAQNPLYNADKEELEYFAELCVRQHYRIEELEGDMLTLLKSLEPMIPLFSPLIGKSKMELLNPVTVTKMINSCMALSDKHDFSPFVLVLAKYAQRLGIKEIENISPKLLK